MAHCPNYTTDVNAIPLNIASDRVYELLFGFMDEMTAVFPDEFIHTVICLFKNNLKRILILVCVCVCVCVL